MTAIIVGQRELGGGGGVRSEWPDALQTVLGVISIWNLRHRERNKKERETEGAVKKGGLGGGWRRGMSVVRVCIINNPDQ